MSSKATKYRRAPFAATKKRRGKRTMEDRKAFDEEDKNRIGDINVPNTSWHGQGETTSRAENPVSASRRKIESRLEESEESQESSDDEADMEECFVKANCWIIETDILKESLKEVSICKYCHGELNLEENESARAGLATNFRFICKNNECILNSMENACFTTSLKNGQIYEINRKIVLAGRLVGKGRQGVLKMCSVLGLCSPVNRRDYRNHCQYWEKVSSELKDENLALSAKLARRACSEEADCENELVDVPSSFDGSWSARGWTASKGIVSAIAECTSQVVDVTLKIRNCPQCTEWEDKKKDARCSSLEYLDWYIAHEPNCMLNHESSPQKIESDGVLNMYERSVSKHNIRYRPFIGDGDSSAYSNVDAQRPYGPLIFVEKAECVNHVTKRMGTNLRSLVKDYKGKKLTDGKGLSGRGRLTIARIDAIQSFYGRTIRDNKNNPQAMSEQTWAILDHYASTPEKPMHCKCPDGEKSWCSYNRDVATGKTTHKPVKSPFTAAIVDTIKPIFTRLADVSFLEKCKECRTQNPNEAFNSVVWNLSPKEQFNSALETSMAVNLAVCLFNSGFEYTLANLFQKSEISISPLMLTQWRKMDIERINKGDYAIREDRKLRRKLRKRINVKKHEAFVHIEGPQYQPQGFHVSAAKKPSATQSKSKRGRKRK